MIHVNTELFSILGGIVIPLLVGVLTKEHAPQWVKSVGLAGLAAVSGAAATAAVGTGTINWQSYLVNIAETWITAVATYYGLWKPTGVAPQVASMTKRFGVSGPKPKPVEVLVSWSEPTPGV